LIRVQSPIHADLAATILTHLDLGKDAASLYQESAPRPSWVRPLEEAYRASPQRLRLQFIGLRSDSLASLRGLVQSDALGEAYRVALQAEQPRVEARREQKRAKREACLARARAELTPRLIPLRAALWGAQEPPDLTIWHSPAMGQHGRGLGGRSEQRVLVNLERPVDQALIQIFHEECHSVSDPAVQAVAARDTRVGTSGYQAHARLEQAAVQLGRDVVTRTSPGLLSAYETFFARYGL